MISKAGKEHINEIADIYEAVHDMEEAGRCTIGWIRKIYPTRATAEAALDRGDLFVQLENGNVVGAAIINQLQPDGYDKGKWTVAAPAERIMVLHTLVIDPSYMHHGLGRAFVAYYEKYALDCGCSFLRMDTNARNVRARQMYSRLGYTEVDIVPCVFNGIPDVQLVLLEKVLHSSAEK